MDGQNVQTWEEKLLAADPEIVAELIRLRVWVQTCIGSDIAAVGGREVDE